MELTALFSIKTRFQRQYLLKSSWYGFSLLKKQLILFLNSNFSLSERPKFVLTSFYTNTYVTSSKALARKVNL